MYIMGSSLSGPVGLMQEMVAGVGTAIDAAKTAAPGSLISELFSEENLRAQQEKLQQETREATSGATDFEAAKTKLLADITGALAIIAAKGSLDEVQSYKTLLVQVAEKVANAAREGGFMGIGGVSVNELEQQAVEAVRTATTT
jgi:hypothetical protein